MTVRSVIQSVTQPAITPVFAKFGGAAEFIKKNAIVDLNDTGIVGSTPVTAWNNSGTGGSAFSPNVILGTGANLTRITQGGHDAVNASGSVGIETTAGTTINTPMTMFLVVKVNVLTGSSQLFTAARSSGSSSPQIQTTSSDLFRFNAGSSLDAGAGDTNLHLHTVRYNGDSSTKYEVDGIGSVIGDAGAEPYQFGTLFASISGTGTLNGAISQYIIFPFALNDAQTESIESYLRSKFGI